MISEDGGETKNMKTLVLLGEQKSGEGEGKHIDKGKSERRKEKINRIRKKYMIWK